MCSEITKREVLFSVIIILVMLILGIIINLTIKDHSLETE